MAINKKILLVMTVVALSGCAGKRHNPSVCTLSMLESGSVKTSKEIQTKTTPIKANTSRVALNKYLLDSDKSIEVTISKYGYTRVSLEDERITDVFVYPQEDIQVKIHQQGYLILAPHRIQDDTEEVKKPAHKTIYVTITGENGTTQDFSLHLTGKPPAPVKFIKTDIK